MRIKSSVILVSALVLVTVGAAGGGWWLWQNNSSLAGDNSELQSELTALRNQLRNGAGSSGASLGASTQNQSGSAAPAAADQTKTMLVKDFGIQFTVPASLTDLSYAENPPASGMLQLTTQTLQTTYAKCASAGILGTLFRYPKGQPLPASTAAGKAQPLSAAGSYQYYYLPLDKNPCAGDKAAVDAVTKSTADLRDALKTLKEQ